MITIITAAWNAKGLKKTIESIDNQEYTDWNHIIINDNNPEVREVFKELCDGVKRHWVDLGVRTHYYGALARNIGVQIAFSYVHHSKRDIENEWVVFHDDDNRWTTDHLQLMVATMKANPEATMIASDAIWVGKNDKSWVEEHRCKLRHGGCDLGNFIYKTSLFREYGYFFPHPRRKHKFDWELINKMVVGEGDKLVLTHKPTFIMTHKKH